MLKILLIESDVKSVVFLIKALKEYHIFTDYALNGIAAYNMAIHHKYDVIISDIELPEMSGLELVKNLRSIGNNTPTMFLTVLGTTEDKVAGFEHGADDYLVKPYEFRELLARIIALARRTKDSTNAGELLYFADIEIDTHTKTFLRNGEVIDLTPKEMALITYLVRHQGRVISKHELSQKVWDINFNTNTNIVEVYINYIRNKVDKPYQQKLIHTVFGVGYVLKEET